MDFIKQRKRFYTFSLVIIIIGLLAMPFNAIRGNDILNYDIEFTGGTVFQLDLGREYDVDSEIKPIADEVFKDEFTRIQNVPGTYEVVITTRPTEMSERIEFVNRMKEQYDVVGTEKEAAFVQREDYFSPTISPEIKANAVQAVLIGTALMLIYISVRFKDFKFGASAVVALIHDVLVMLAVYSVFRIPVNNMFIAAMLTIIGYSINDTIIVFDRIRENKGIMKGDDSLIINTSIHQTLTRSVNTSITTLIMVTLLFILGTDSVKQFAFPLMIGVLSGTYSSIFVAGQTWFQFRKIERKSKGKKAAEAN